MILIHLHGNKKEATQQLPEGDSSLDAALVGIDLPVFVKQIKVECTKKESDRNAITVFKTKGLRIVLVALN